MPNTFVKNSPWESDIITVTPSYYWSEFEIKISITDYKKDFEKRSIGINKHEAYLSKEKIISGQRIIPKPKYFRFVVPAGLLDDVEVPKKYGVFEYGDFGYWKMRMKKRVSSLTSPTKLDQKTIFNLAVKASSRILFQ